MNILNHVLFKRRDATVCLTVSYGTDRNAVFLFYIFPIVYDPYKPYGCDPFVLVTRDLYFGSPNDMHFSDRIRIENGLYRPYKPYGSTGRVTLSPLARGDLYSKSP